MDERLLQIYPIPAKSKGYICPVCKCQLSQPHDVLFKPNAILADIECTCCEENYYQTIPYEFSHLPKVSFLKNYTYVKCEEEEKASIPSLLKSFQSETTFRWEVHQRVQKKHAIWINCLYDQEAEALQRLVLLQTYLSQFKDLGSVVLIRYELLYLIPNFVSEIWVAFTQETLQIATGNFNTFVHQELRRFQEVYLPSLKDGEPSNDDLQEFFHHIPVSSSWAANKVPVVTFYCHSSEFWLGSSLLGLFFSWTKKCGLGKITRSFFEARQLQVFLELAKHLDQEKMHTFYLLGVGNHPVSKAFVDKRCKKMELGYPHDWLSILGKSNIIIGVFQNELAMRALCQNVIEIQSSNTLKSSLSPFHKWITVANSAPIHYVYNQILTLLAKEQVGQIK